MECKFYFYSKFYRNLNMEKKNNWGIKSLSPIINSKGKHISV